MTCSQTRRIDSRPPIVFHAVEGELPLSSSPRAPEFGEAMDHVRRFFVRNAVFSVPPLIMSEKTAAPSPFVYGIS